MPPEPGVLRLRRRVRAWTLAGAALWLAAVVLAPVLGAGPRTGRLAALIYAAFSPTCHQRPDRCFSLAGGPLAVCARCLGIYAGFLLGTLAAFRPRGAEAGPPRASLLLAVSVPIGIDVAANVLGLWSSSNAVRLATGLAWGAALPAFWIPALADAFQPRPPRPPA